MSGSATDSPSVAVERVRITAAAVLVVLVPIAGWVISSSMAVTRWDLSVLQAMGSVQLPVLRGIAVTMNWLFSPARASILIVILGASLVIVFRAPGPVVRFFVLVLLPWTACTAVKNIVQRPRPSAAALPHHLAAANGLSYPSGHTTIAFALCLALVVVLRRSRWRPALVAVAVVIPASTAFARMYSGVHYPTDVAASFVLTGACVVLVDAGLTRLASRVPAIRV